MAAGRPGLRRRAAHAAGQLHHRRRRPAVNLFFCVVCACCSWWLTARRSSRRGGCLRPATSAGTTPPATLRFTTWSGGTAGRSLQPACLLTRLFWVNYVLFLFNMVLVGFPMDGGRMLQSVLWPRLGYRQATLVAVFAGFVITWCSASRHVAERGFRPVPVCSSSCPCKHQWIILETGGEEQLLGYDFSQGYTSLERDQPPAPRRRRQNWWQRWLQQRAAKQVKRELEKREAEERRMDELLEKSSATGMQALTDEERRFLKRVSDRYRNRS